ncbi:MAG TPA: hypothetical protein VL283_00980 [Candidatus Baltobacteraceae bacterium]|jgi:hypothetical protein|nr:hypothetical protein [Candidatus Baltobacteraceae bacterium]
MPRNSAAEAWPQPQDEIEDLSDEAKIIEPPPLPKSETEKALEDVRELNETHEDAKMDREREEASAAATAEIRKTIAERDKAAMERARRALGASVLQELPPEDVKIDAEDSWANEAERALGPRKKAEPPPIPAAARKPEAKKPWYKRLFGSKES